MATHREFDERREAYWRDYALPVLRAGGFRTSRQGYRFENARGDSAVIGTRHYLNGEFRIEVAVSVAPVTRLMNWLGDTTSPIGAAAWATHLNRARPGEDYLGDWPVPVIRDEREHAGAELAGYLTDSVLPLVQRLLDYDELLDEIRYGHLRGMTGLGTDALALALLAERGPTGELDSLMSRVPSDPFHENVLAYVRHRLAELGHPDDSWRGTLSPEPTSVDALLRDHVDSPLAAKGYRRHGHSYRRVTAQGDVGLIDFELSGERFAVVSAVLPEPELDFRAHQVAAASPWGGNPIDARHGWLTEEVRSPSGDLWWRCPPDQPADLVAALARAASRLDFYLDRESLRERMLLSSKPTGESPVHLRIVLGVDAGPSPQLDAAIEAASAYIGPIDPELAIWARKRLANRQAPGAPE